MKQGPLGVFHHSEVSSSDELKAEVGKAGFTQINVLGIEGPAWVLPDFDLFKQPTASRIDRATWARRDGVCRVA